MNVKKVNNAFQESWNLFKYRLDKNKLSHSIFIAGFPKSGSTYLSRILLDLSGYKDVHLAYNCGRNDQDIYRPYLIKHHSISTFTAHHTRGTDSNIQLLNQFHLKPILNVRNIFDVLISYRDHCKSDNTLFAMAYLTDKYFELAEENQLNLLIDLVTPWYINFFVSWYHQAIIEKNIKAHWNTYNELINEPFETVKIASNFVGLEKSDNEICEALKNAKSGFTRLNKGIEGRGSIFTDEQKDKVRNFTKYYPWVDFSKMGL
jgi:hypothetical protein